MIPLRKKEWLKEQGELWINTDRMADTTGKWTGTDGAVFETGEFYAVETLYCKVQRHFEKHEDS